MKEDGWFVGTLLLGVVLVAIFIWWVERMDARYEAAHPCVKWEPRFVTHLQPVGKVVIPMTTLRKVCVARREGR